MSAIERCRTAALGGHVARCENDDAAHTVISYNSCRNRHCPKCQGAAAASGWPRARPSCCRCGYFHVVYTLPSQLRDIAYQNKRVIYDLLMKAAAETTLTIAADPKHLGARIGITAVLHTWGSALTHHPHVHMIVPGGGLSDDGSRWVSSAPALSRQREGAVTPVPGSFAGDACRGARRGPIEVLRRPLLRSPTGRPSRGPSRRCAGPSGSSTSRTRSADPSRFCAICRATRTASPSPIAGWSRPTTAASRSAGRTTASKAPTAGRR